MQGSVLIPHCGFTDVARLLSFLRLVHAVRWVKMGAGGALIPVYPGFLAPVCGSSFAPPHVCGTRPPCALKLQVSRRERITRGAVCEQHTENNRCAPAVLLPCSCWGVGMINTHVNVENARDKMDDKWAVLPLPRRGKEMLTTCVQRPGMIFSSTFMTVR